MIFRCEPLLERLSEAQGGRCAYCGFVMRLPGLQQNPLELRPAAKSWRQYTLAKQARRATRDHLLPRSAGGDAARDNLVAACQWCNGFRANQPFELAHRRIMRLIRRGSHPHQIFLRTGWWPRNHTLLPPIHFATTANRPVCEAVD